MIEFLFKTFKTSRKVRPTPLLDREKTEVLVLGGKIQHQVKKLFHGSLFIRQVDAGSDNACEQELVALSNAYYDVERFGIHFVASPRHADMLMITGPVTGNMAEAVRRAVDATPDPKIIVAVGDDAIDGGIFKGSYAGCEGAGAVVPVHYGIPGDPPTPTALLTHLLNILETLDRKPVN